MRKIFALLLALTLLSTLVAPAALAEDKVQIHYVTWDTEDDYTKPIVEKFNASQDRIEVIYSSFPSSGDEYTSKVLNMLTVGRDIDMFGVRGLDFFADYVAYEALLPLDELIQKNSVDLLPFGSTIDFCQMEGKYYALPHRKTLSFLMYSPQFFEKMGMEDLGTRQLTWAEANEIAKQCTTYNADGTQATFGWGGLMINLAGAGSLSLMSQYGQLVTDDDCSAYQKVLDRLYQYYMVDKSAQDYATAKAIGMQGSGTAFLALQCGLFVQSDFILGMLYGQSQRGELPEGFDYNITYLPIDEGMEPHTTFGSATTTAIAATTEHPEEAFEFLCYLCGEEGAQEIAKTGVLPAYSSETVEEAYRALAKPGLNIEVLFNSNPLQEAVVTTKAAALNEMTLEEVEQLYIGAKTPAEVYESWNARRLDILSE